MNAGFGGEGREGDTFFRNYGSALLRNVTPFLGIRKCVLLTRGGGWGILVRCLR